MKIRDAQVTAALAAWEGQPTRVEAMRAALEAAKVLIPEPEYEYGTKWEYGPLTYKSYLERSREDALAVIEEDRIAMGLEKPRGILVRRTTVGEWEEVEG